MYLNNFPGKMVRYCVVKNCNESDKSILAHRFPKGLENRIKWQKSLNLQSCDLDQLYNKFVVCINHFKPSDYRNSISKHLNVTAVPHLSESISQTSTLETQDQGEESGVEIMDMSEIEASPKIPVQPIKYEIISQSRRKRTDEEMNKEISDRTKETIKKITTRPLAQIISVKTSQTVHEKVNEPQKELKKIVSNDLVHVHLVEEIEANSSVETACQTELQNDESEFGSLSRADLLRLLHEKDEKIEILQKKIIKFESAISAFKLLMNPSDLD